MCYLLISSSLCKMFVSVYMGAAMFAFLSPLYNEYAWSHWTRSCFIIFSCRFDASNCRWSDFICHRGRAAREDEVSNHGNWFKLPLHALRIFPNMNMTKRTISSDVEILMKSFYVCCAHTQAYKVSISWHVDFNKKPIHQCWTIDN